MKRMPLIYTAGPYRSDSMYGVQQNVQVAHETAAILWNNGFSVICPHKNTFCIDGSYKLTDQDILDGDLEQIYRCDAVFLLPRWEKSEGTRIELEFCQKHGIPVLHNMAEAERFLREWTEEQEQRKEVRESGRQQGQITFSGPSVPEGETIQWVTRLP